MVATRSDSPSQAATGPDTGIVDAGAGDLDELADAFLIPPSAWAAAGMVPNPDEPPVLTVGDLSYAQLIGMAAIQAQSAEGKLFVTRCQDRLQRVERALGGRPVGLA